MIELAILIAVATAPPSAGCAAGIADYKEEIDTASRYAALNEALGTSVSASVRSANEARESNALSRARMAREAIAAAGCHVPVLVPSSKPYIRAARKCELQTIMSNYGGGAADDCDPERWTKSQ